MTFQRVLQPHSWILLSQKRKWEEERLLDRDRGGETRERKSESTWSSAVSSLTRTRMHWLPAAPAQHIPGGRLLHADPALMLNYVWNFTHMLTHDKRLILYCLNLAKPSVCSQIDFQAARGNLDVCAFKTNWHFMAKEFCKITRKLNTLGDPILKISICHCEAFRPGINLYKWWSNRKWTALKNSTSYHLQRPNALFSTDEPTEVANTTGHTTCFPSKETTLSVTFAESQEGPTKEKERERERERENLRGFLQMQPFKKCGIF